jgi:hypothetical protein
MSQYDAQNTPPVVEHRLAIAYLWAHGGRRHRIHDLQDLRLETNIEHTIGL